MKAALALTCLLIAAQFVFAETPELPSSLLDEKTAGGPPQLMLNRYLLKQMDEAEARIVADEKELDTAAKLKAWQQRLRKEFVDALGGFPERTALNAKVLGTVQRDGYRVEKILFESRPQHFVTAALFLPDENKFHAPYPAILIPCGHSKNGKAMDAYQRAAVIATWNGMTAFVYDPIDQGERMQEVDAQGKFKVSNVNGHNKAGVSAQLLGWNTASFRIWDGMRAIDYLTSRPEIDAKKIGCMGNSGGGTLTAYLMALDERIVAASPSCYISTLGRVCTSIGPQDAEQNIFGQMAFGMDHAEYLLMRAPTPVLVACAEKDYFPLDGVKEAVARGTGVFTRLGFANRIERVENAGKHGWAEPLRVAGAKWMARWLLGKNDIALPPIADMGLSDDAIRVTEHGQVMLLPGARSVYDLMRDELARLDKSRKALSADELRQAVRRRAGIRALDALPKPKVEVRGEWKREWGAIRGLTFETAPGLMLPAFILEPAKPRGTPVVLVHGLGKRAAIKDAEELARQGRVVLAVDLTGFGETQGCKNCGDFEDAHAKDEADGEIAYLLGRSLVGMRAEDILVCSRWLAAERETKTVGLKATSWAVTPALHAAMSEQMFSAVTLSDKPLTWHEVLEKGDRHRYSDVVHGAVREYDLPDLERAIEALMKAK